MAELVLDRSNPIFGTLGLIFICYLSWRRWNNTDNLIEVINNIQHKGGDD